MILGCYARFVVKGLLASLLFTLEYRIIGGGLEQSGGLEMVQYNDNRGWGLEQSGGLEMVRYNEIRGFE